ncbi:DUF4064 domain-containing protein [Gemelliphila palaticanis]|uniref:DUF4064 domain-containing protein n=1 Tax=Gemelliphila palaticanis TaxID=81950 RepID=A0ABX2T0Y3_9BACL|nr:DUF4064 domain-containing protein [Gemella palaticanis]MBF0715362.1 DUF4064 domain-containing protein [Gemella palaticanis]NYS47292.1 DUF4064 domain-containing protein [Gemella palaticanis]
MNKFSRTAEKVLAWIANICLIFITYLIASLNFNDEFQQIVNSQDFHDQLRDKIIKSNQEYNFTDVQINQIIDFVVNFVPVATVIYVVVTILAIIISFTMKKRIFSGIMFLILAIVTFLITVSVGFFIYLPYFIVAIMLFARKPPVDINNYYNGNTKEEVEKIEYV